MGVVPAGGGPGWRSFAAAAPELAAFVAARLQAAPAYLATVRAGGAPRVHPVTPVITDAGLFVFMEPASPKGNDLRERGWFALHNAVPNNDGVGGEAALTGTGHAIDDPVLRAAVAASASYEPAERYVLFELCPTDVRVSGYGDVVLPEPQRWRSSDVEEEGR